MLASGIILLAAVVYSSEGGALRINVASLHKPTEGIVDNCTDPPLHRAIIRNETGTVLDLLFSGEDMYEENCLGLNAMEVALKVDNEGLVSELVEFRYDLLSRNQLGETVLHSAIHFGRSKVLRWFLKKNITFDIDAVSNKNETPLFLSVLYNNSEAYDMLLRRFADPDLKLPGNNTYVHQATRIANVKALLVFASLYIPIDAVNEEDETALSIATRIDKPVMINVLLYLGADFRRKNNKGETYIHTAVKHGSINALRTLLRHHELIDEENTKGKTPLKLAVEMNKADLVNCLIEAGANFKKVFAKGKSYTHIAAQSNSNDALRVLLERGIPPDVKDSDGFTASYDAVLSSNVQALEILKEFGADLSLSWPDRKWGHMQFLHIAAMYDKVQVIRYLVAGGVSVNVTTEYLASALHVAADNNALASAEALLDLGVCINCTVYCVNSGEVLTPYDIADRKKCTVKRICALLASRGGHSVYNE